jgi:hypothetical protein
MRSQFLAVMLIAGFGLAGCEQDGPAENLGERVDDAIDEAGDRAEDVRDELEDAADEVEDALE